MSRIFEYCLLEGSAFGFDTVIIMEFFDELVDLDFFDYILLSGMFVLLSHTLRAASYILAATISADAKHREFGTVLTFRHYTIIFIKLLNLYPHKFTKKFKKVLGEVVESIHQGSILEVSELSSIS